MTTPDDPDADGVEDAVHADSVDAIDGSAADDGTRAADEMPPAKSPTGVRAADDARSRLDDLPSVPLEEHVDIYEDVHRRLHEGLADLDES